MNCSLVGIAVLAVSSVAAAESLEPSPTVPSHYPTTNSYFGVSAQLGDQRMAQRGVALDAGTRIASSPLFVRAQGTIGRSGDSEDGSYQQLRLGAELRSCRQGVCLLAGVDAGYQHDNPIKGPGTLDLIIVPPLSYDGYHDEAHDALLVPRVGIEMATAVRFRASCESPVAMRLDRMETNIGVACSGGIGFGF